MRAAASRRDVILSIGALGLTACGSIPKADWPASPARFIDVHCHVFNGRDVPAAKFVLHVVARESGFEDYAKLAAFFVKLLTNYAPTAADEERHLSDTGAPGVAAMAPADPDQILRDRIVETLYELRAQSKAVEPEETAQSDLLADMRQAGLSPSPDAFKQGDLSLNPEATSLSFLASRYARRRRARPSVETQSFAPIAMDSIPEIADGMVSDMRSASSPIGAYLAFVRVFMSYREENVARLDADLGLAHNRTASLYVPQLVDYNFWLDAETDTTPLPEQANLMAAIALRAAPGVLVNGFMAFDPLRAALHRHGKGSFDPQQTVEAAICARGFIGVKLYPPMGFRATGNAELASFGPIADRLARELGLQPSQLGAQMDAALDDLYCLCIRKDIPILAHCSNSQTSFQGSGLRAAPVFWERVLATPAKTDSTGATIDYSKLRLNLAHFGSVWCESGEATGDDERARCAAETVPLWPAQIVDLAARYPNVYFDLADLGVLTNGARISPPLTEFLASISASQARVEAFRNKMLYGTDWMFLPVSAPKTYPKFPERVGALIDSFKLDQDAVFWRNAASYLGLVEGRAIVERMRQFHAKDKSRLDALSALLVPGSPQGTGAQCPTL